MQHPPVYKIRSISRLASGLFVSEEGVNFGRFVNAFFIFPGNRLTLPFEGAVTKPCKI